MIKTFGVWFAEVMPLLCNHTVEKIEGKVIVFTTDEPCDVLAYWAGAVLRIDLKPKNNS